eukprot:jgi/Psemu1/67459/estExt_Genemark1.C_3220025
MTTGETASAHVTFANAPSRDSSIGNDDDVEDSCRSEDRRANFLRDTRDKKVIKMYNLKSPDYRSPSVAIRRSFFDLRTEAMRTEGVRKQGRIYSSKHAQRCGGLRVDEMIYGLKMAHLSCTDDGENRLEGASPNCMAAMEHLVGGDDPATTARLPLSQLLEENFGLKLDCWIDESGYRKGRPVDTQGFIASNDTTIVLSFRFTTSIMDWLANLTFHHSEWEPDEDVEKGHAGWCSQCCGWFTKVCNPKKAKPRVQTAYYNNFIYVYVAGCSLGAAMAQIAYCYILEKLYDKLIEPEYTAVERLINVTAGCPRVGDRKFADTTMQRMRSLRTSGLDRAVICRLVYNQDIVPHAPPHVLSFRHIDKLVYITKNGEHVLINPDLSKIFSMWNEIKVIYKTIFQGKKAELEVKTAKLGDRANDRLQSVQERLNIDPKQSRKQSRAALAAAEKAARDAHKTDFELECENALEGILDHMPYWYMTHLEKLKNDLAAKEFSSERSYNVASMEGSDDEDDASSKTWTKFKRAVRKVKSDISKRNQRISVPTTAS